ncbi:MAG TPA: AMP-binding protein, partial [Candidatus Binataceae bacterium]
MEPRTTFAQLPADPGSSAPAIIVPSAPVVVSYKSLAEQVERLAAQFSGAGLEAGDVVAIILPNGLEFLVVFLALTRARLVAAPINPADKSAELRFFITAGQARAVIAESGNSIAAEAALA